MAKSSQDKPISEIMTRNMCQVGAGQTVMEALTRMRSKSVSSVLVVDNGEIRGIITERDFVKALRANVDFNTMICGGLMQSPVISVTPKTTCLEVYHLMSSREIRHLAVIDGEGDVVGVASEGDLMRNFGIEYYMNFKSVLDVMNSSISVLKPSDLVADAVSLMLEKHQSCVLVVDGARKPIGVLTERDIVWLCGDHEQSDRLILADVMRSPVVTATTSTLLHEAVKSMAAARIRRLAVVDEAGAVIGLLTHHEIVREMEGDYSAHFHALAEFQSRVQIQFKPFIDEKLVLANLSRLSADTAVLAVDLSYVVGYVTPGANKILGLEGTNFVGMDVRQVLGLIGWEEADDDIQESALSDGNLAKERTIGNTNFSMRVFLMRDPEDRSCGFLVRVQRKSVPVAGSSN